MITHVVFIQLKDRQHAQNLALDLRQKIQQMSPKIAQIQALEVGLDFSHENRACDLCLIVKFKNKQDLSIYATHPSHLEVLNYIKQIAEYTKVVDFEN